MCRMDGCLAVSAKRKSGGLALLWKERTKVTIQNYSKFHIDALVGQDDGTSLRFTGFYGNSAPDLRMQAWDILRRIKSIIKEGWIVGGDFNDILNESEKSGGRRKSKTAMAEFCELFEDLSMSDTKTRAGWFTWSNNREGSGLVKERLDRFLVSVDIVESMPFIETKVIRQSKSDHYAILLDTVWSKPRERDRDPDQWFRYDMCWSKEQEAKDIIKSVWSNKERNLIEKVVDIRERLGPWQYNRYKKMRKKINALDREISNLMDKLSNMDTSRLLKLARGKFGHLYDIKERYWSQRARIQWLREGDRNTRYFHVRATSRKKKNHIERLNDSNGVWHEDSKEICNVAWIYFNELFKCSIESNDLFDLNFIPCCVSESMNKNLDKDFTEEEILKAFNQMDPRKAPCIDGLPGCFFKDNWPTVGKDVLQFCHEALRDTSNIHNINETLIVLIPKIANPNEMTNFRPISLCRVIYKIISKVLANRLKEVLPMCITQNQSAFVPGQMIHDNVLIAHELIHYLRSSKNGPNKGCVVKLDMSKAYDRVEWGFREKVMLKLGDFAKEIPYPPIFLFFMDALSRMLINAQENDIIKGIRASKDGPRINHLFFADDTLLFVRNNLSEVRACMKILDSFRRMSGQSINANKSMVCFSLKTPIHQKVEANGLFRMKVVDNLDSYLGLPIPVGKKKSEAFKSIMNRTANRINSWSKRLLSSAGKEIFVEAVIQSIPTYALFVFLAPSGVLSDIKSMIGRVWWGGGDKQKVWSRLSWDRLCFPKSMGGIGFKDLHLFNVALLGRQVWRLIECKDTLYYRVLSAKYFPNGDIFHLKKIDKPSFTWKSISKAADMLRDGFGWNVGNGKNIGVWKDNWGFKGLSGSSIRLNSRSVMEKTVSDLMEENGEG
ncbi:reverse transcriptase [Gossypium australe]|uniref:Reverse transcriptase n=1 Tax=Gossypium australe TaxID=47621 RepID=A0A5B6ULM3_9ROSI|nr:reverse transcriptase [Gossypium australe]